MIDTTEAVRLAAEALARNENGGADCDPSEWNETDATAAVTAALPALAEQFAALIEAERARCTPSASTPADSYWLDGLDVATRLVREAAEVTG